MSALKKGAALEAEVRIAIGGLHQKQSIVYNFFTEDWWEQDFVNTIRLTSNVDAYGMELQLIQTVPKLNALETVKAVEIYGPVRQSGEILFRNDT